MQAFPQIEVSVGTKPVTRVRVLSSRFGDSYEQTMPDGLNNIFYDWQIVWDNISIDEAFTIVEFLQTHKGSEIFSWIDPKGDTYNYRCKEWDEDLRANKRGSISAVFERAF